MATSQQLTVTMTYADDSTEDVTDDASYESADTDVATVSSAGLIEAVGEGSTTVTASMSGLTAECAVTVANPPQSLAVSPTSTELELEPEA